MSRLNRFAQIALFVELPLLILGGWLYEAWKLNVTAIDFTHAFLPAAHAVVHASSPYPTPHDPSVLAGTAFVYPPLTAFLVAPLLLIPPAIAAWLVTGAMLGCLWGALWLFRVRDWRCYGVVLLWYPTLFAIQTANLSLPLLLAAAATWRLRDRPRASSLVLGAAVGAKLVLWPLFVWLAAVRRTRSCVYGIAAAAAFVILPWAAIGFAGLTGYGRLASEVDRIEGPRGYTLTALAERLGAGDTAAVTITAALGAFLIAGCIIAARHDHDRTSFAVALAAALLLSPIVWLHYLVLVAAICAVFRPRLGAAWFVPLLLWLCPAAANGQAANGTIWQLALAIATPALVLVVATSAVWTQTPSPAMLRRRAGEQGRQRATIDPYKQCS
jgi:hypothetical protein